MSEGRRRGVRRWPVALLVAGGLSAAAFGYGWSKQSGYYAFLPDTAHPADKYVHVPGGRAPRGDGEIFFVDVRVLPANLIEEFWARHFVDGAQLVPARRVVPPGQSEHERLQEGFHEMAGSQQVAQAVAERALGRPVRIEHRGALVVAVTPGLPAAKAGVRVGDSITAANGRPVRTADQLLHATSGVRPGDGVRMAFRKAGTRTLRTVAAPDDRTRGIIGVQIADDVHIGDLPVKVRFSTQGIGGPSAGLAFALEIYDSLSGRRLLHGHKVTVTGALDLAGQVHPIGGVQQKTLGAIDAGADTFVVPAGENFRDARAAADGRLRVVPVRSFRGALAALRKLPPV
jgi:PDZ domain-containing protein